MKGNVNLINTGFYKNKDGEWRFCADGHDLFGADEIFKTFLFGLSNREREDFLKELLSDFCSVCFTDTREHKCHCWNDD